MRNQRNVRLHLDSPNKSLSEAASPRSLSPSLPAARGVGARAVVKMVLTRPQHHNRRGVPAGITFGHNMGCQLACCDPGSRQELATRRLPLPYDCRIAFLMGCSRAVPRLAEDCAPSLRRMPLEVVRRIIELCTRCAHETQPTTHALVCSPSPGCPACAAWSGASSLVRRCL